MEAYCVKCRTQREMKDPKEIKMANGRPAMQGTCTVLRYQVDPHHEVQLARSTRGRV